VLLLATTAAACDGAADKMKQPTAPTANSPCTHITYHTYHTFLAAQLQLHHHPAAAAAAAAAATFEQSQPF
jgi:hypothetical protein